MSIPNFLIYAENVAETTLATAISSGSSTAVVADASSFPQSDYGLATSVGSSTVLNTTPTAVNGRAPMIGDIIINWTDGSSAVIKNITTGVITTTCLKGGANNIWNNGDEWSVRPFGITINKRSLDVSNHMQIMVRENVLVKYRNANTLYLHVRGWNTAGYSGSVPTSFATGDYVSMLDMAQYFKEVEKRLASLEIDKLDACGCITDLFFCGTMDFSQDCEGNPCQGKITGLAPNPTDPTAPTTNQQFNDAFSALNAVLLSIYDNDGCHPHKLSWVGSLTASSPAGSEYRVYINNVLTITRAYNQTTWTDYNPPLTNATYRIDQYDAGTGQIVQSNQITMVPSSCYNLACGDWGDSADGILTTGGSMNRRVYRFSSINLSSQTINFTGSGKMVWIVDGNVNIAGTTINSPATTNGATTTMTIHTIVNNSILGGRGLHGSGGAGGVAAFGGGTIGAPAPGGNGLIYDALTNSNAFGGNNGWANPFGQTGHNSAANTTFAAGGGGGYGPNNNAYGGLGGVGGTSNNTQPSFIIICKGTINISTSTINGNGSAGTNGGLGSVGGFWNAGNQWGGSGGGGGGAGGSDGMKTFIYHLGTSTGTPTYNAAGGAGGNGGISQPFPGVPGTAGGTGTNGNSGVVGTLTKITLTC